MTLLFVSLLLFYNFSPSLATQQQSQQQQRTLIQSPPSSDQQDVEPFIYRTFPQSKPSVQPSVVPVQTSITLQQPQSSNKKDLLVGMGVGMGLGLAAGLAVQPNTPTASINQLSTQQQPSTLTSPTQQYPTSTTVFQQQKSRFPFLHRISSFFSRLNPFHRHTLCLFNGQHLPKEQCEMVVKQWEAEKKLKIMNAQQIQDRQKWNEAVTARGQTIQPPIPPPLLPSTAQIGNNDRTIQPTSTTQQSTQRTVQPATPFISTTTNQQQLQFVNPMPLPTRTQLLQLHATQVFPAVTAPYNVRIVQLPSALNIRATTMSSSVQYACQVACVILGHVKNENQLFSSSAVTLLPTEQGVVNMEFKFDTIELPQRGLMTVTVFVFPTKSYNQLAVQINPPIDSASKLLSRPLARDAYTFSMTDTQTQLHNVRSNERGVFTSTGTISNIISQSITAPLNQQQQLQQQQQINLSSAYQAPVSLPLVLTIIAALMYRLLV